jgi:flagellar biogenesis protein FliO
VDPASRNWLQLSAATGTIGKNGSTLIVQVNAHGLLLGTYTGQITLAAEAAGTPLKGSPSSVAVMLTVIL